MDTITKITPAVLPLALVNDDGETAVLTLALTHPPTQVDVRAGLGLGASGARAQMAYAAAEAWYVETGITTSARVVVELATPNQLGLLADATLSVAVRSVLATVHGQAETGDGLDAAGQLAWTAYTKGGVFTQRVGGGVMRQATIEKPDSEAWVLIGHYPRFDPDLPATYEAELTAHLLAADAPAGADDVAVWAALERDDFGGFAAAVGALHRATAAQLSLPVLTAEQQMALAAFESQGAVVWGRALSGQLTWGLVAGQQAAYDLRRRVRQAVGHYGGTVFATVPFVARR